MKTLIKDIYAFHTDLGNPQFNDLVPYWCEVWRSHGWTPHVLNTDDARVHPKYNQLISKATSLPTFNNTSFETACYKRWCAFAMIQGSGVVTDYDVFPRVEHFPPVEVEPLYCGDPAGGPGFIGGFGWDFERILDVILSYKVQPADQFQGHPHVADMTILFRRNHVFDTIDRIITCYGKPDWETLPLTHFGNAYLKRSGELSKVEEIRQVISRK